MKGVGAEGWPGQPECPSDSALQGLVHMTLGPFAQLTIRKWREAALQVHGLGFVDTPTTCQAGPLASLCLWLQSGLSRPRTDSGEGPQPPDLGLQKLLWLGVRWEAPGWSAGPLASRVRWVASPAQTTTAGSRHQVALSPPQRCSPVLPTFSCHSHQVGRLDHRQWCPREEVQSKQVCGPGLAPGSWVGQEQSHHVWSAAPLTVGILQVAQGFPWDLVRI